MTCRRTTRWRAVALLIVAGVAITNLIHTVQRVHPPAIDPPAGMDDPLVQHEKRFARFRLSAEVRALRGTIGYVGDLPVADDDYYYTQFALVPLVIDFDPEPYEWAVANLRVSAVEARLPAGWRVAEAFGDGVYLLRKAAP